MADPGLCRWKHVLSESAEKSCSGDSPGVRDDCGRYKREREREREREGGRCWQ